MLWFATALLSLTTVCICCYQTQVRLLNSILMWSKIPLRIWYANFVVFFQSMVLLFWHMTYRRCLMLKLFRNEIASYLRICVKSNLAKLMWKCKNSRFVWSLLKRVKLQKKKVFYWSVICEIMKCQIYLKMRNYSRFSECEMCDFQQLWNFADNYVLVEEVRWPF